MGQCVMGYSRNRSASNHSLTIEEIREKPTKKEIYSLLMPLFWPSKCTSRPYIFLRVLIIVSLFSLLIGKALAIFAPMLIGWCITELGAQNMKKSLLYLTGYVLLIFASVCFDELRNFTYRYVQYIGINDLSLRLFEHVHHMNYHWFTSAKTGQTIRAIYRGCESMRELSQFAVITLVPTILESIVVIIVFFTVYKNYLLGIILLVGLIVYFVFTVLVTNWRLKTREDQAQKDNEMHSVANDSVNNFEAVKLFGNEDFELKKYGKAVYLYELFNLRVLNSLSIINVGQELIRQVTTFLCFVVGILQILKGNASLGTFMVIQTYLFRIFRPLHILGTIYGSIVKSMVGLYDAASLLKMKSTVVDHEEATEVNLTEVNDPLIEFNNVSFSYSTTGCPMDSLVLKNINFKLEANKSIAIVGPTGTGKTTIFRLLSRLYDPLMGQILINGKNIKEYKQKSLRSIMGVVSQDTILFHDSIRNNVKYAKLNATDEEIWEALKKAELYDRVMEYPDKLDTLVGERGIKLSGGEKQRMSIARCFLKNPPVIVLDEATSALDSKTESQIQKTIAALVNKKTTLTIAHRLSTIVNSDLILVLFKGEIIELGKHEDLLKMKGFYKSLWDIQLKKQLDVLHQDF
ncbi:ABC transporter [Theileria orientalis strain Shintoku]|uniref:ABC transporter n=1 Tax=Theileria orientalis strain Shintoku TaxID=869250 RepID=J4CD40_THEOR|nr:ABC transporter [Theileria orientalis strain Shintoku]BAM40477.1 ABC transporter [Theileria orientalis strain Shintoku]|eukprot:XP_009690778.1 ABC transporter [Theileria orientalis strain Shintoku]